jgi:hypothetical protein
MSSEPDPSVDGESVVTEKPRFSIGNVLLGVFVGVALTIGTFVATVNSLGNPEEKESNTIASTGTHSLIDALARSLTHSLTHSVGIFENILYDLKYNYVDDVDIPKLFNTGITPLIHTVFHLFMHSLNLLFYDRY